MISWLEATILGDMGAEIISTVEENKSGTGISATSYTKADVTGTTTSIVGTTTYTFESYTGVGEPITLISTYEGQSYSEDENGFTTFTIAQTYEYTEYTTDNAYKTTSSMDSFSASGSTAAILQKHTSTTEAISLKSVYTSVEEHASITLWTTSSVSTYNETTSFVFTTSTTETTRLYFNETTGVSYVATTRICSTQLTETVTANTYNTVYKAEQNSRLVVLTDKILAEELGTAALAYDHVLITDIYTSSANISNKELAIFDGNLITYTAEAITSQLDFQTTTTIFTTSTEFYFGVFPPSSTTVVRQHQTLTESQITLPLVPSLSIVDAKTEDGTYWYNYLSTAKSVDINGNEYSALENFQGFQIGIFARVSSTGVVVGQNIGMVRSAEGLEVDGDTTYIAEEQLAALRGPFVYLDGPLQEDYRFFGETTYGTVSIFKNVGLVMDGKTASYASADAEVTFSGNFYADLERAGGGLSTLTTQTNQSFTQSGKSFTYTTSTNKSDATSTTQSFEAYPVGSGTTSMIGDKTVLGGNAEEGATFWERNEIGGVFFNQNSESIEGDGNAFSWEGKRTTSVFLPAIFLTLGYPVPFFETRANPVLEAGAFATPANMGELGQGEF